MYLRYKAILDSLNPGRVVSRVCSTAAFMDLRNFIKAPKKKLHNEIVENGGIISLFWEILIFVYRKTSVSEVGRAAVAADNAVKESIATCVDANINVREEVTVDKHALISLIVFSWEVALNVRSKKIICINNWMK